MGRINIPRCFICMDRGFIMFTTRVGNKKFEYYAHCTCRAGNRYIYDGGQCTKDPSRHYMPSVDDVLDSRDIAEYNFNAWRDTNKNKPGFAKAMQRLGQEASL